MEKVTYRVVDDVESLEEVGKLQLLVWGPEAFLSVPHIIAVIKNGGVVIGAFLEDKMIGFCFGFPGYGRAQPYLVSHMMATHPDLRGQGMGRSMKVAQRQWALTTGYDKITWTFDPLESRNAFLNLCKLGGYIQKYIPDYYGEMRDKVNQSLPTDRLLLEWDIRSPRVKRAIEGGKINSSQWALYPKLVNWKERGANPEPAGTMELDTGKEGYLLPVPAFIQDLKKNDLSLANEWRLILRHSFMEALDQSYTVTGILQTSQTVHYYVLEKEEQGWR